MAIVYRGLDRSLKRTVAIKVLHKHLSDYQEARDRFEREAQAVAKLRHENILEIYDYAAKADEEAYIVTEFIDGQTLKQFITDRPLAFPEVGAMVVLQVCRALAHAHAGMILHRDVKPENIMIRGDGVVKLMDFGISHMVDLERLTVTGQLLGSPAYMAPEHVEGKPIDFRTDVFAAGIVLYQLAVGRLPFEGKNPHEVLKRIAECKFVDPRVANPRIGNRLGRIILRAMAAEPADRYQAIGEMVLALVGYCEESGLPSDKIASELARYFKSPVPYEEALRARLLDHLTRRGQELLAKDEQAAALDVFDRVLTIDPKHVKVLAILDGIGRRRRLRNGAIVAAAALVIGGASVMLHRQFEPPPLAEPGEASQMSGLEPERDHVLAVAYEDLPAPIDAAAAVAPGDVGALVASGHADAGSGSAAVELVDAAAAVTSQPLVLTVNPPDSKIQIGEGTPFVANPGQAIPIDHDLTITARNSCCNDNSTTVHVGQTKATINLTLKNGRVLLKCDRNVDVRVDDKPAVLGSEYTVHFNDTGVPEKTIEVEFTGDHVERQSVHVTSGKVTEVTCASR
jgi:serine/threonine-protein kinase